MRSSVLPVCVGLALLASCGPRPCKSNADCAGQGQMVCSNAVCGPGSVDGGGAGGGSATGGGTATGGGVGVDAGVDAGLTRYPDGGTLFRHWDGGSCAVKTDCPCFSSDDCGPGFRCVSEDTTGLNVFCVPGARGAGLVGAPCTLESDCLSALCVTGSDGGNGCSALCETAAECAPAVPRCTYVGFGIDRSICSP